MIRLNLVLLFAVLASALYLVGVQYESRQLTSQMDKAQTEARRLEAEKDSLQVAKRSQAAPARVERLAQEKLHMRQAQPGVTNYVSYGGTEQVAVARAKVTTP